MPDNFIWTKHVEERSYQRGITSNEVWSTLRSPDHTEPQSDGSYKFFKKFNDRLITLVAKPQGNNWVILTTYTKDTHSKAYKTYVNHQGYKAPLIQRLVLLLVLKTGKFLGRLFH